MITGLKYVNSAGAEFDFDRAGVHPVPSGIWDWEVSALELNGELAYLSRSPRDLSFDVTFAQGVPPQAAMDDLYSVCAVDVAGNSTGALMMGEWSIPAVLTKSEKTGWWRPNGPVSYALTFRCPRPWWTRSIVYQFFAVSEQGTALDYPHDYPFDYGGQGQAGFVSSDTPYPCDFVLRVYGPATNPYVVIGGNRYEVDVTVPAGGLLVVDSEAPTVELIQPGGAHSNVFDDTPDLGADDGAYIFAPIQPGDQQVSWDGTFGFDLVISERRDERTWSAQS